jgi:2-polyprenyl-6-methoxyphenol hydroxylase-like FAD-dependent oxidoreductase
MNQTSTQAPSAIVVGAGIGGMASALLLARAGAHVTLLEKVDSSVAVGAGLLLQPNGLAVLAGLGLDAELERCGHATDTVALRRADGRVIASSTVPVHGPGLDHVLVVRRSVLHAILLRAVGAAGSGIEVRFGADVVESSPDGSVVVGGPLGRERLTGDLVVAADGVHSGVRRRGDFGDRVRPTGTTYLRAIVDADLGDLQGETWTSSGLFGGAPLGDGSTYFYAAAHAPAVARAVAEHDLASVRETWSRVLPASDGLWAGVASFDDLLVNDVARVDADRWHDGAIVLLGDAAHAMAPTLGQGANSALVDAAVLVHELTRTHDRTTGLAAYADRRRPRVRAVQDAADRLAGLSDLGGRLRPRLRDAAIGLASRIPAVATRQDRLAQQEDPEALRRMVGSLPRELQLDTAQR